MTTRLVDSETPTHWPEGLVYPATLLRCNMGNLLMHLVIGCYPECMCLEKGESCLDRQVWGFGNKGVNESALFLSLSGLFSSSQNSGCVE